MVFPVHAWWDAQHLIRRDCVGSEQDLSSVRAVRRRPAADAARRAQSLRAVQLVEVDHVGRVRRAAFWFVRTPGVPPRAVTIWDWMLPSRPTSTFLR